MQHFLGPTKLWSAPQSGGALQKDPGESSCQDSRHPPPLVFAEKSASEISSPLLLEERKEWHTWVTAAWRGRSNAKHNGSQVKQSRRVHLSRDGLTLTLTATYFQLVVIPYIIEKSQNGLSWSSQIDSLEKHHWKKAPKSETYQTNIFH